MELDSKKLREVAGAFATGITVVTIKINNEEVKGITANSFVSISLDPALVGFFVITGGSLMEHLKIDTPLGISILSSKQQTISHQFAGLNDEDIDIEFDNNGDYSIIKNAKAWYKTKIVSIQKIGDHHMIVCSIKDLGKDNDKQPLLYYSGYKQIDFNL